MALLGTWWDKTSLQTLGGAAAAVLFQTIPSAVATIGSGGSGSTNPDFVLLVVRSVQAQTAAGTPFWFGGNPSIQTIGLGVGSISAASQGLMAVDCFSCYLWNPIR